MLFGTAIGGRTDGKEQVLTHTYSVCLECHRKYTIGTRVCGLATIQQQTRSPFAQRVRAGKPLPDCKRI